MPNIQAFRVQRDGECLFHAISVLCADGGARSSAAELRKVCADSAARYAEEISHTRGLSVADYAGKILDADEWGDVLEARMLVEQRFPKVRLVIWNLEQGFPVSVGEGGAPSVGHMVHTGTHFDPLVSVDEAGDLLRSLFADTDAEAQAAVEAFVAEAAPAHAKHMRCDECGEILRSNAAAQNHMELTEHCFFSEVSAGT
mmetsp:Transcript_78738/g.228580  ORF Transcript_78738/g.228580 Transcript_78738/m.228580 type:complete len:200 (-) Transcript_78738:22-621(-)